MTGGAYRASSASTSNFEREVGHREKLEEVLKQVKRPLRRGDAASRGEWGYTSIIGRMRERGVGRRWGGASAEKKSLLKFKYKKESSEERFLHDSQQRKLGTVSKGKTIYGKKEARASHRGIGGKTIQTGLDNRRWGTKGEKLEKQPKK